MKAPAAWSQRVRRLATLVRVWRGLGLVALALACLFYAVPQVRGALHPQLAPPDSYTTPASYAPAGGAARAPRESAAV